MTITISSSPNVSTTMRLFATVHLLTCIETTAVGADGVRAFDRLGIHDTG